MKKSIFVILLVCIIFLNKANLSFASTLYSNDFTKNKDFWNTFYDACSTSNDGLTCQVHVDALNTIYFPTLACVSGDFTSNGGPNQLFISDKNTSFDSYVVFYIQKGHHLQMNSNLNTIFDSGVESPSSGKHMYTLCKNSNTYTSYVDNTLIQTQIFTGHSGGYVGFQTVQGDYLKNFIVTDKLPGSSNTSILYSNNMTSNFWNTFFGICNISNSGLTCSHSAVLNTTPFPNLKCLKGDFDSTIGNPQLLFASDPFLTNVLAIDFNNESDILIKDLANNNFHTGILVPTGPHSYEVCQDTNQINIYIDNTHVYTFSTTIPHLDYIGFSLYDGTSLTNLTATDTYENFLSVPLLKQTDPQWGSEIYDGASHWSPGFETIGDWGCAMTSAAMILQSHGIYKLPDGTGLNPGTLNTWLKNQPDGYLDGVTSGNMNPWAISRLSKQATAINNITDFDALEYQHIGANAAQLTDDLHNNQPDMLEEPGHFIVATGINGNTFDINDPYNNLSTLDNTSYHNTFLSLNRYIPSHTDLSYILLTINPSVTVVIKDQNGQPLGDQFVQQPYNDPLHNNHPGWNPLKMIFVQKPLSGTYHISLSGSTDQNYQLHTYLYDKDGNVHTNLDQGTVGPNTSDTFTVNFNNQDSSKSDRERVVTFQSFIDDVHENVTLQQINKNLGNALISLIKSAQFSADHQPAFVAKLKLKALAITINAFHGRGISDSAYQILLYDDTYLQNH